MREGSPPPTCPFHVSHVTFHVSHVTCHMSSGEACRWRVCYKRGIPCLVFICMIYVKESYLFIQSPTIFRIKCMILSILNSGDNTRCGSPFCHRPSLCYLHILAKSTHFPIPRLPSIQLLKNWTIFKSILIGVETSFQIDTLLALKWSQAHILVL